MIKQCGDMTVLRRFLDEQLSAEEEGIVCKHLARCGRCRSTLESLTGGPFSEETLRKNLAGFDPAARAQVVELSTVETPDDSLESIKSVLAPTDDPAMLGRLGKYEICALVGRGSSGLVFKARDPSLNRYVAIKLLMPSFASSGMARKRFEREGRAIGSVRNAHVIQVYGVDEFRGTPYIVMQYLPAGSLQKRLDDEGPLSATEVCRIGLQIAWGLEAAHQQGIVHRDIKPANVLLESGLEQAIVSDFGLARVTDEATMTHTGSIAGTPQYMSPEQARGKTLDARTDLFSLGSVLYAACTGSSPFRGETLMGVIHQVGEFDPRPIREINPEIPKWLEAFIFKLLSKNREGRFESAQKVAAFLAEELAYLQMPTSLPQPQRPWLESPKSKGDLRRHFVVGLGSIAIICVALIWWNPLGSAPHSYGIQPTEAEKNFYQAKSAYDLAYETHLKEASLAGDMRQSIERHKVAVEMGYDRANSNYLLARAYAIQADTKMVLKYLRRAIEAGFHDLDRLQAEGDFNRILTDPGFQIVADQIRELGNRRAQADNQYFQNKDFEAAESLYRQWLVNCPKDDLVITLLGASLTEQGKTEEAKRWNEKARQTIQYAKFANYNQGCVALLEGNVDLAFAYLNYAIELGFSDDDHLKKDRMLFTLHQDSRFQELLDRMKTKQN